jgi:hypothetical protein
MQQQLIGILTCLKMFLYKFFFAVYLLIWQDLDLLVLLNFLSDLKIHLESKTLLKVSLLLALAVRLRRPRAADTVVHVS